MKARSRTTITVDRELLDEAQGMTGRISASETIDHALRELLKAERLRRDIAAYEAIPPTVDEVALAQVSAPFGDLADETDWEATYADQA